MRERTEMLWESTEDTGRCGSCSEDRMCKLRTVCNVRVGQAERVGAGVSCNLV